MNAFGQTLTPDDVLDALNFFDTWEDKYKYILDLAKDLPVIEPSKKDERHLVKGCQSQVWVDATFDGRYVWIQADSDAFIVRGLLAIVLIAYNAKTPQEILEFNIEQYFDQIGLMNHLSLTRGNGLRAVVTRIQSDAALFIKHA